MTKQAPFAREDVVEAYLDGLLKEPDAQDSATARAAKLLEQAAQQMAQETIVIEDVVSETANVEDVSPVDFDNIADENETIEHFQSVDIIDSEYGESKSEPITEEVIDNDALVQSVALKDALDEHFQALFFEVAGLTLAVPLITLGGIYQLDKIGPLFGKPDWYMGVMIHRGEKLNVVDSAKWVMPEKYDEVLAQSLNYRYLIMLGNSLWGLTSEKLINTVTLAKADVKWRESTGKRPWLAGMVKEKMCALIDVDELISMLNKGLGSNDQTP